MNLTASHIKRFQKYIWKFWRTHRRDFPWRQTRDPYAILVSEYMLQQTQTSRVVPYFEKFMKRFPTVESLAEAPLAEVLTYWSGLGYNRRGVALKGAARKIVEVFKGKVPRDLAALLLLPGVGAYTAAAIRAFAFDLPAVVIETNIRAALTHYFHPTIRKPRSDAYLLKLIEQTMPRQRHRIWYSALMDYGAWLKVHRRDELVKKVRQQKQSTFKGSLREARGRIVSHLLQAKGGMSVDQLQKATNIDDKRFALALKNLLLEKIVRQGRGRISVAN